MSQPTTAPRPVVPIKDHCAIVHNDTLYVYSPEAFQSLPLKNGASWSQQSMGQSVTGAVCVDATDATDPAIAGLYIIGGNSQSDGFTGIQKYSFSSSKWETINPIVPVTKNRVYHGAAFLPASGSILVYGGSQEGHDSLSTQTFLMSLNAPYAALAYSSTAPPVTNPLVMRWADNQGIVIGGSRGNRALYTFQSPDGWFDLGTSLPQVLPDRNMAQSMVVHSNDGSRSIEIFDTSVTPNKLSRHIVLGPGGVVLPPEAVAVDQNSIPKGRRQARDFRADTWAAYDPALAPKSTKPGFALVPSQDGRTVIVSSDPDNSVAIFDQKKNSWVDTNQFFGIKSSPNPSKTDDSVMPSMPSSSSSAPNSTSGGKTNIGAIAGGIVGGIFALIVIVAAIIYFRRRRFANKAKGEKSTDDKGLDFADCLEPNPRYLHSKSNGSTTSVATSRTPVNGSLQPPGVSNHSAATGNSSSASTVKGHRPKPSDASSIGLVNAGSLPGYRLSGIDQDMQISPVSFVERDHVGLPQITVNSPPSSFSTSPADQHPMLTGNQSGISVGEVSSGTVSAAVVPAIGSPFNAEDSTFHFSFEGKEEQRGSGWSRYFEAPTTNQPRSLTSGEARGPNGGNINLPYIPGSTLSMDFTLVPNDKDNARFVDTSMKPTRPSDQPVDSPQAPLPSSNILHNKHLTSFDDMATGHVVNPSTLSKIDRASFYSQDPDVTISAPHARWVADEHGRPASSVYGNSILDGVDSTFGSGIGFGAGAAGAGNRFMFGGAGDKVNGGRESTFSTVTVFPSETSSNVNRPVPTKTKQDMSWFNLGPAPHARPV